jgi:MbtH protein
MTDTDEEPGEDVIRYAVVVNDEEQYSIWRADSEPPGGWHPDGTTGTRQACLDHIAVVWTDLRPRSLREAMAAAAEDG